MINKIDSNLMRPLLADLINIKQSLSRLNGTITKLAELAFIDYLRERNLIDEIDAQECAKNSAEVSAYANGYDIFIPNQKIVAEIKALIPYEVTRFGGAQIQSLEKDVKGLLEGKAKAQEDIKDFVKILALLPTQDEKTFSKAVEHLIENLKKKDYKVSAELPENNSFSKEDVYVVTIPLN